MNILIFRLIISILYLSGIFCWKLLWEKLISYQIESEIRFIKLPYWFAIIVLLTNLLLTLNSEIPEYKTEIGIYGYVEGNAITTASFSLSIAVFVVPIINKKKKLINEEFSQKFLQLTLISFLFVVIGVLPLYWVPQKKAWLTLLRHFKTIPCCYSIFILATAIIVYLHSLKTEVFRN